MKLAIIDYETTGLDASQYEEPIELHIQIWTPERGLDLTPEATFYRLWMPQGPVHPKAQEANRFTEESWMARGAVPMRAAHMYQLNAWLDAQKPDMWCGSNVGFDLDFFKFMYRRVRAEPTKMCHRKVDIESIAALLLFTGEIKAVSPSLQAIAEHFGIVNPAPHTSSGDVVTTARCLEALAKRLLRV